MNYRSLGHIVHFTRFVGILVKGRGSIYKTKTMQNKVFVFLFVLAMGVIGNIQCKNRAYCSPDRHMFYLPAGDLCKKCDKCNPGWGLEPEENAKFEISEHGAMGCRKCKTCDDGYFNRWRSYDGCKRCKDCDAFGRSIKYRCTQTRNTKCGKKLPISTESTTLVRNISPTIRQPVSPSAPYMRYESSDKSDSFGHKKTVLGLLGSTVGLLALFIGILVCLYYVNCRKVKEPSRITMRKTNKPDIKENDVEADGPIELESYPCLGNTSTRNKAVSIVPVKNEELTAKQLMFVAKRIAPKEGYREVALDLNMEEIDISIIEEENPRCCQNRAFKILKKWTEIFPDKAYVTKLLTTLDRVNRQDIVRNFCREFREILVE